MTATALPATRKTHRSPSSPNPGVKAFNRLAATCLTLFALIWLVPFAWALITSLRPDNAITANPVTPWAGHWTLHAYSSALTASPIGWWYLNSFIISTLSVIFTLVVCSMIGFGLAHLNFRGKSVVFAVILAGLMLPTEALVLPQFLEFRTIHLLGTYWALVLPVLAAPVAVFIFHAFLKQIPVSLIEAARAGRRELVAGVLPGLHAPVPASYFGGRDPHLHHDLERFPVATPGPDPRPSRRRSRSG